MRYLFGSIVVAAIALALSACSDLGNLKLQPDPGIEEPTTNIAMQLTHVNEREAAFVMDNNVFACDLFASLGAKPGNLVIAPASISPGLAMAYAGAHGGAADEIAAVLHFKLPPETLHPAFASMLSSFNEAKLSPVERGYRLTVANSLWGQAGYSWNPAYRSLLTANYGADLQTIDFRTSDQARAMARQAINVCASRSSRDQITQVMGTDVLGQSTRLVLVTAASFKGDWAHSFTSTATEKFAPAPGLTVAVPMMQRLGPFRVYEDDLVQMLELPYQGKQLSLLVLLPRADEGLRDLEKRLTAPKLDMFYRQLRPETAMQVALPRFRVDCALSLHDVLRDLGIKAAFEPAAADFSGMAGRAQDVNLALADVRHEAVIEVDEHGSNVKRTPLSSSWSAQPVQSFRADRPFVFVVRDNRSGAILLMGRVVNPRS
jgi:serpin B